MEADYANKWQMYETKVKMLSESFRKVKEKLTDVSDRYRALSFKSSNNIRNNSESSK